MTGPTFSPDGQWMWDGNAWIPAPPQANVLPQASLNQNQISTVANNAGVPVDQLSNTAPYFDQNRDGILQNSELQQAAAAIAQPPTMPVPMQSPQPPVMQQPMVQQPMMQQPMVQQPVMQQPMVQQPMVQQPMVQQPMTQNLKKKNSIKTILICAGIVLAGIGVIIVMWGGGSTSIELDSMNETNSLGASPGTHDALFSFTVSRGGDIGDSPSMDDSKLTLDVNGMTYTCWYGIEISSINSDCIYVNVECLPYSTAGPLHQVSIFGSYGEMKVSSTDYESASGDLTESVALAERDAEFCMRTGAAVDSDVTFTVFEVDFDICSSSCYLEMSIEIDGQDVLTDSINVPLMDHDNDNVNDFVDKCPSTSFSSTSTDSDGCSDQQRDTDGDGVLDVNDWFVNGNGKLNIWVSKVNTYSEENYEESPAEGDDNDGYLAPDLQISLEVDWDCDQTYDASYSMKDEGKVYTNKYLVNISKTYVQEQGWLLSFDVLDEQVRVCFAVTIFDYDSDDGTSNILDASSLKGGIGRTSVPLSWIEGSGGQKFQGNLIVIDGGLDDDDDEEFQTPREGGAATYTVTIEAVDGSN